ncbi:MAG: ABC transporter permease subunit/CPBP intramembrane protease [Pirellulaceae bacterium]|nr:ABC transporter permease subunit/CPBP intramembrane protease [Pirellulaceae bacterium]
MLEMLRSGRFWRMCVKELRETLRDRRTLFTLVLMPLLVYPLLSMTLQRLLLSSASKSTSDNYLVGVQSDVELEQFGSTITDAQEAISRNAYNPIRIEVRSTASHVYSDPKKTHSHWKVAVFDNDLNELLESGRIDLAIAITAPAVEEPKSSANIRTSRKTRRFEVRFRQGDAQSESAVFEFRRLLQTLNDQQSRQLREEHGMGREAIVELEATAIGRKSSIVASLAAVVPLILLLMTITGAVYPAIDLTAGERERGTMEALISTPVPRFALLLSKYVAIVTVSVLTAIVNVSGMIVTFSIGGLGKAILGEEGVPWLSLLQIFPLLIVFSGFFSAILLAMSCVAKSFKEAQAYLIPTMLLALGPGVLSVMPGIYLTPNMAVVPLFNMILLARDVLAGQFHWFPAIITLISTFLYAVGVMALAARIFGRNVLSPQSDMQWKRGWKSSTANGKSPMLGDLFVFLAIFFPIYFVASNTIGVSEHTTLTNRLWIKASLTLVLFLLIPIAFAWWQGFDMRRTFRPFENRKWIFLMPGLILLVVSLWTVAHEIFVISELLGIATLRPEQLAAANQMKLALQELPLLLIWLTMAIVPAIAEEAFFRGFALRAFLSTLKPGFAIAASAILFGAFHVLTGSVLSIERFLPTAALGGVLGWLAWRSGSLMPGWIVHAGHNGLLFTIARYEEPLREMGWGVTDQRHLPVSWVAAGCAAILVGLTYCAFSTKKRT